MKKAVFFLIVLLTGAGCFSDLPAVQEYPIEAKSAMVASAHPLASRTGVEILKQGGNAVDAAVAAAFTLSVVEPHASGIGGGGFMLIYLSASKEARVIDYREMAPRKADPNLYRNSRVTEWKVLGPKSVAVPGCLAGLSMALKKFGTKTLSETILPAARIAEEGFEVSRVLSRMMRIEAYKLSRNPDASRIFLKDNRAYEEGERISFPDLARTYREIARRGPDLFYRGDLADAFAKEMSARGDSWITKEDLAGYEALERSPVQGKFRGFEIFAPPLTAGGVQVLELLNILEGFGEIPARQADGLQVFAEAQKRVVADRRKYLGDPDFTSVPVRGLLSPAYAATLRKGIHPGRPAARVSAGAPRDFESEQTTHISVVDAHGNIAALTQTINNFFGSAVVIPGTGILLNNEMNEFVRFPGRPNSFAPGKRPLSSMSPMLLIKGGRPYLSIGSAGATRIISALPQVLMNLIDRKMNIQQAVNAPRVHWEERLYMESRIPRRVRRGLADRGYNISVRRAYDIYFGGVQAILIDPQTGTRYGAADPRRDGAAIGY